MKKKNNLNVIKNLNFEIKQGDKIGVIGKNGSLKTTLLKILSNRYTLDSGIFKSKIEFLQLDTESFDLIMKYLVTKMLEIFLTLLSIMIK